MQSVSTTSPLAAAIVSLFALCQSGRGTSTSPPKEITSIKTLMRNVLVFDDFLEKNGGGIYVEYDKQFLNLL